MGGESEGRDGGGERREMGGKGKVRDRDGGGERRGMRGEEEVS